MGSIYVTAVREAFMKMEDENITQLHPDSSAQELEWRADRPAPLFFMWNMYIKNKGQVCHNPKDCT